MSDVTNPLVVVGTVAGLGALSVAALLFYGSYVGIGSAQ
ncbi:MAG: photosystem II reaction center protein J [Coleofasciculaceae cyanobacterium RL_1_1]|nr:photosystem II reaction center protein J [Coleofasciculaceae cyanobacterium RL_1_1]